MKGRLAAIAPVIPAIALLLATFTLTLGQTPDSVQYLLAAEGLAQTREFGAGFLHWPPLYPVLLSFGGLTWAAVLANLCAVATVMGAWAVGRTVVQSRIGLAAMLLALVLTPYFGKVFGTAWSEAVYVPLTIWLMYFWADYLTTDSRRSLVASCVLLALALLTRHVGVVLVVAMALMARPKVWPMIGAACIPYALWVARTFYVSGTYAGVRIPKENPDLWHQLELFGRTVGHWFVPHVYFLSGGWIMGLAFLALALGTLAYHYRRSHLLTFAALFVLGHSVLTVYSASRVFLDVDARTMFPVFFPTLLLVVCAAQAAYRPSRWFWYPLAAYALFWFSAPNTIVNALV